MSAKLQVALSVACLVGCGRSPLDDAAPGLDPDRPPVSRVDVVLAVDNSTSMQEEIAALQGPVFDSFPNALLSVGDGLVDFRLAVVDGCISPPVFHDAGDSGACRFSTGRNFMVSSSPRFAEEYACVMELSTAGFQGQADTCSGRNDDEQPASTAAAALAAREGPNAGFLRDDAALLLVVLTDEDENPIPHQAPEAIAADLIAAKGASSDVTVLGIGADHDCDGPYGEGYEASTLRAITDVFVEAEVGVWWNLCDGDLEAAFDEVIAILDARGRG